MKEGLDRLREGCRGWGIKREVMKRWRLGVKVRRAEKLIQGYQERLRK
jgi:hypothetical protein